MEICHLQAFDRFVSKKLYYISLSSIYEKLHHKIEKLLEKQQIWTGKKYTLCQKKSLCRYKSSYVSVQNFE